MLKPNNILKLCFGDDFDLKEWLTNQKERFISKEQQQSIVKDLEMYIMILAGFGVVIIFASLAALCGKKIKNKIIKKVYKAKNSYMFNGYIKSVQISYIQTVLTSSI